MLSTGVDEVHQWDTVECVLACSRQALEDEDFVMWVDADLVDYPGDIIQKMIQANKCVHSSYPPLLLAELYDPLASTPGRWWRPTA